MTIYSVLALLHGLICGLIALRIAFFRRQQKVHKPAIAIFAYLIFVSAGMVPFALAFKLYLYAHVSTVLLLMLLCLIFFINQGNVAQLLCKNQAAYPSARRALNNTIYRQIYQSDQTHVPHNIMALRRSK